MVGPFDVDGRPVLLRRWLGAADRLAEVRRQAALWSTLPGALVVAVRDVVCVGADLVVVSEADGEPLDVLLARRALTAGQVVTLVVGVARSLAAAHERGLAHGRLDAASVVIDDAGRPRITGFGLGADADPLSDVAALVAMASTFVDCSAPAALTRAFESAVDAHGLAESVLSTTQAESLLSYRAAVAPMFEPTRAPAGGRVRAAIVLTTAAALLATVIGVSWGRQEPAGGALPPPRPSPAPVRSSPAPSMHDVVAMLERRRVRALAHADANALAAVEVPATSLWRRDSRTVSRLGAAHLHLQQLRVRVVRTDVLTTSPHRTVVRVVDAMSSYEVVDAAGVVVDRQPSRGHRQVTLVLVRQHERWKIRSVSRRSP